MGNTLTNVMGKIVGNALPVMRRRCAMPQIVNSSFKNELAESGDTINLPVSVAMAAQSVVPAVTQTAVADIVPGTVPIALDQWYQNAPIHLTDKEQAEIMSKKNFLPMQWQEAIEGLCTAINQHIYSWYYKSGMYYKNTTNTFSTVEDATMSKAYLNINKAPKSNRWGVLDYVSEAHALKIAALSDTEKIGGEMGPKFEGEIGRKYGINWLSDDDCPQQVQGAVGAGAITVTGTEAIGATTITLSKGAGASWAAKKGDLIHIAGEDDGFGYSIQADVSVVHGDDTDVTILPGLREAKAATDVVTPVAGTSAITYYNCPVFHYGAIGFANRPMTLEASGELGNQIQPIVDPVTGMALRLEVKRLQKLTVWEIDCLWGSNWLRPEHVVRVIGY